MATKKASKKTGKKNSTKNAAPAAASLDRSTLAEKERVYSLAKKLGITSKELIMALDQVGLVKVAQSTLTREETDRVLDSLSQGEDKKAIEESAVENEERIRHRVRKNVDNEIHQIEEKVEADLSAAVEEMESSEPLEEVTPELTPAPQEAPAAAYVPIFQAPEKENLSPEEEALAEAERPQRRSRRTSRRVSVDKPTENHSETAEEKPAEENNEPVAMKGSTRLEAKRRRRAEMRAAGQKRSQIVSQAEFLARRESVERAMVIRERPHVENPQDNSLITQVGVLEDDLLVEHFVTSHEQISMLGNIYLGRVQNVLKSMEAAFIDIGTGRNGVLYASEFDWRGTGLKGRNRRIENALKSGDQVLVQVSKDPVGSKGARLTTQISLAGRYLVYVPEGRSAGISRKLPGPERARLKEILEHVLPEEGGAIIRTAAENASEEAIRRDVDRLRGMWEEIRTRVTEEKESKGAKPATLYEEPSVLVRVVRDLFNEDFSRLIIDGEEAWTTVKDYVYSVAPDLSDRLERFDRSAHDGQDAFEHFRIDEQLHKALARKVWLPSGGHLIIDRTEAMTVIDVNTGKFTGAGGNLEETVTRNNLEAAEEIVRQMRLRDIGGMIVVDFIDMVLPENQELVLRRLKEALGRDRTRHQVSEVTSLGLVQMTRKRLGVELLDTFSTTCTVCGGRGVILHEDPVEQGSPEERRRTQKALSDADRPHQPHRQRSTDEELEKLAAAVIPDEDAEEVIEEAAEENTERRSRRRGGRGRSRGRGVSYEEAVEEFESSPRRKRATRGNSRSDHRPRPEDFEPETTEEREETAVRAAGPRNARRRVARRSSRSAKPATVKLEKTSKVEKVNAVEAPARKRRRAVRRARRP